MKFRLLRLRPKFVHLCLFLLCLFAGARNASAGRAIILSWNPSPDPEVKGYQVLWGTASGRYVFTNDVGMATGARIVLPVPGVAYYFAVVAYVDTLVSPPSEEVVYQPPEPTLQLALTDTRKLRLNWAAIPGKGYRILYQPKLGAGAWTPVSEVLVADSAQMQWTTGIPAAPASGFFKVQVVANPTQPPTIQMAPTGDGQFRLSWTSIPGRGYRVLYKPTLAASSWTPVSAVLLADSTFMQWSTSIDPAARTGFFIVEMIVHPEVPPTTQIASGGANQIKLSWISVPGMGYRVCYKPDLKAGPWTPVTGVLTADSVFMEWSTLIDPASPSGFFTVQPVLIPDAPPAAQIARSGESEIKLSWSCVPGLGYRVLHNSDLSSNSWTPITGILTSESGLMEWTLPINPAATADFFLIEQVLQAPSIPLTRTMP